MNQFFHQFSSRLPVKPLTAGLFLASLIGLGVFALLGGPATPAQSAALQSAAPKPALSVAMTYAKAATLPITLAANGSVRAWQEAQIGAQDNGLRVLELHANVGDAVKRGQLLATFDGESVQADVALARAALAEARANGAEALANAERARAVQGSGALSAQQVSQYVTAELTAQARVASAQAQLAAQLLRLKHTRLLAPDSGIVSARLASVGAVLPAGAEMFRLIRQGRLEWQAEVTANELSRISVGTAVVLSGAGGAQLKGRVRMVAPTVDAQTRNGLVFVELDTRRFLAVPGAGSAGAAVTASFKPGMFARGEFELGRSATLSVLQTAVVVRDGFSYVYSVEADNRVQQRKVSTGRVLGDQVEILDGIGPQDRLVASGAGFLSDGDTVRVVANEKPASSAPSAATASALPLAAK